MAKPKSLPYEAGEAAETFSVTLHSTVGGADKIYKLAIEPSGGLWVVNYANGRRGTTLTTAPVTKAPVAYAEARKQCNSKLFSKVGDGYVPIAGSRFGEGMAAEAIATIAREASGMIPQLLLQIDDEAINSFVMDDAYGMEIKYDGERRMLEVKDGAVVGGNRKGQTVALSHLIAADVSKLPDVVLDGEQIGDAVYVWDVLSWRGEDLKAKTVAERKAILDEVFSTSVFERIGRVPTAYGTQAKREMLAAARLNNEEGIVFKRLDAVYEPGKPGSKATWLKVKFWRSLSAVVGKVNDKRSVALHLHDGDAVVAVGNVTIPANHDIPEAGDVVEVRYLYAYEGGSLFQPTYLGRRSDIVPSECLASQRIFKPSEDDAEESAAA